VCTCLATSKIAAGIKTMKQHHLLLRTVESEKHPLDSPINFRIQAIPVRKSRFE
jgi:hypothetical protein